MRALGVLIRNHPRTALDMLGSGLAQAGRVGIREIKNKIKGDQSKAPHAGMPKLTKRQLRRLARTVADESGS